MSARWSSEHVVAEHKELQANAMAVDCLGQFALLAGRRALAIVDLRKPSEIVKKVLRQSKWEVNAVQWNPHNSHSQMFVTANNQKADLCNYTNSDIIHHGSLKSHTRVISDLDWSPIDPNVIATCSVDTFTYVWDIREFRRPTGVLQAVAGASQVKWNKVNGQMLATAHDGDIRIWDHRKSSSPLQYIAGHSSKIHGLDWSRSNECMLATSGQDCTVKFWDVNNPRQSQCKLSAASPVWRARYTPFGGGLVTVFVPQLRRGENSLFLWQLDNLRQPLHTFVGHRDVVLEFHWRNTDSSDYQLVTWSKDQSLRIWTIDPHLLQVCGHDIVDPDSPTSVKGETAAVSESDMNGTVTDATKTAENTDNNNVETVKSASSKDSSKTDKSSTSQHSTSHGAKQSKGKSHTSQQKPQTLQQEFSLVNIYRPNMQFDEMDAMRRTCTVTVASGKHIVKLVITFPEQYPHNVIPTFQFVKPTNVNKETQESLIKVLCDTSLNHAKNNRNCMEPCLRHLLNSLEALTDKEEDEVPSDPESPYKITKTHVTIQPPGFLPLYSLAAISAYQDVSVPFPRTSGARFCGSGQLVCFFRKTVHAGSRRTSSTVDLTPRAMSALSTFNQARTPISHPPSTQLYSHLYHGIAGSPPTDSNFTITNYYNYKDRRLRSRSKSRMKDNSDSRSRESVASPQKKLSVVAPVVIYNIDQVLPLAKNLAEHYILKDDDISAACLKNASVSAELGRKDLAQVWSLAALSTDAVLKADPDPDEGTPWASHPFGKNLLKSLLEHYSKIHDVQTLAMLCCTFGEKYKPTPSDSKTHGNKASSQVTTTDPSAACVSNYNAYHTIHPSDTTLKGWNFIIPKLKRSNSWTESIDDCGRFLDNIGDPVEKDKQRHKRNMKLLEDSKKMQYDQFKKAYAEILYRWGLFNKRAEVLKYVADPRPPHQGLEFVVSCPSCEQDVKGAQCTNCKEMVFQCAICHISVRGNSSFCLACGHGGHTLHMMEWFHTHTVCPTGCGCKCLEESSNV